MSLADRLLALGLFLVLLLSSSGCLVIAGSTEKRTAPTIGQELQDLQAAREKGVITEGEYQTGKSRLLQQLHD